MLSDSICTLTECDKFDQALLKISKESRVKISVSGDHHIISAPKRICDGWTKTMRFPKIIGLNANSDLEKGKYEGGLKVWEGTYDLVNYINTNRDVIGELFSSGHRIDILELGAGASLATLAFLYRLFYDPEFNSNYRIHIQDYNWQVLASITLINLAMNLPQDYLQNMIESKYLLLFHGDWMNFSSPKKYHLIFMSEVIYNIENYESLHNLLNLHTKRKGFIVIATKDVYFGLTGGLHQWLDFVEQKNIFYQHDIIKTKTKSIPRSIIILRRK